MSSYMKADEVRDRLVGAWHLVSWEACDAQGAVTYPLGPDAVGQIMYAANGLMSAQIMRNGQARFENDKPTAEERARAWRDYFGYFGPYTIDEEAGAVTHHIKGSWSPNLVGTKQARHYRFEGNRLILKAEFAGGNVQIVWEKGNG